jgi:hypothetical protein
MSAQAAAVLKPFSATSMIRSASYPATEAADATIDACYGSNGSRGG